MLLAGLELKPFILVHTSSMVSIYAIGMIAAVRLLRRYSAGWWMAVIAAVLCGGMLVLALSSLLPAAGLAVVAIAVTIVRSIRRRRRSAALDAASADAGRQVEAELSASRASSSPRTP
jgi:amino acid efflux transporter